jgi:predicted small lipoprotein YifL
LSAITASDNQTNTTLQKWNSAARAAEHNFSDELAAFRVPIILLFSIRMKKVPAVTLLVSTVLALLGCGSPGPSPEQQARDADQQREAERQQAEFRKSLPTVSNPGQGW